MRCIDNLINGNLEDAKRGAKNNTFSTILSSAEMAYGMTMREAINVAKYLKGEISFAQYCQEKHAFNEVE